MKENRTKPLMTIGLAGNPNSGKTTLFNALTGEHCYVGNWPGVTVEKRVGTYYPRKKKKDEFVHIVDLPGIYSLSPYSPEEIVSRHFLIDEHPDLVIDVVDGTNLERNLFLTSEILEIDVPVIVAVNMMDAVKLEGREIDLKALSRALGVPVVPVSALKEDGLKDLIELALKEGKKKRLGTSLLSPLGEKEAKTFAEHKVVHPLFHALKVLEGDKWKKTTISKSFKWPRTTPSLSPSTSRRCATPRSTNSSKGSSTIPPARWTASPRRIKWTAS